MKQIEINGVKLEIATAEEKPELTAKLINECERRNSANPDLIRINKNTWIKKPKGTV